jgi:hypothetical protein
MANPRAFVSFDFDHDEKFRKYFVGQGKENSPTPFVISDWSSKDKLPQKTWEQTIDEKIGRCNMLIVLVGRSTAGATGVVKEIAMAKGKNVPIFGVYVNDTGPSTALPAGLARNRTIKWTWPGVAGAIKQMMQEGKNKK